MHIALIVGGYTRSLYSNIDSWKKFLIKENTYDIYLHLTENEDTEDKYYNIYDIEKIKNKLNIKFILISKNIFFTHDKKINDIYNQFYKYLILNNLKNNIMHLEKITYDKVVKIRPDVLLLDYINLNTSLDKISVPYESKIDIKKLRNSNDMYLCDIIAYGDNNVMDDYFNIYNQLENLINLYGFAQETLLYYYLNNNTIKYELVDINFNVILSLCNIINICGDSASGKTTLSEYIKKYMKNSFILECDRYHKWEGGDINWENYTHLNPEANYLTKMHDDVFDLKVGKNIYQVDYDHSSGKFTDKKLIESKENVIVCGLHTNYLTLTNLSVFMDTDDNLRIPWKINRDMKKRGYSYEKIMEQISSRKEDYIKYIYPQILTSNIIINLYTKIPYKKENNLKNLPVYLNIYIETKFNILDFLKHINNLNYKYTLEDFKNTINRQYNLIKFEYLNIDYNELIIVLINMLKDN